MTATLVLGGPRSGKSRHAAALLAHHPRVTVVDTSTAAGSGHEADPAAPTSLSQEQRPEAWDSLHTLDLTRALLASRQPVLIDDLGGWLQGVMAEDAATDDPGHARDVVEARLDELSVALRAVPFDVVTVSHEPACVRFPEDPSDRLFAELLARVNQRVSASSTRVHAIIGGRVLDLSSAPLLGTV